MSKILNIYYNDNQNENIIEIGIDEVGRGPLFGRVYTAAVILPKDNFKFELLKDSKKFHSKKKLKEVYNYIKKNCISYNVSYCDEKTIDNINIKQATFKSMHLCINNIINSNNIKYNNYLLLIDGNDFKPYTYLDNEIINIINYKCIEGGDNKYCSIAAASILAKVERDNYIEELCLSYPKLNEYYDLLSNKGYGTKKHIEGLNKFGISKWHRKTYARCNILYENTDF